MQTSIGLDFGTNSVRALLVDCADGRELATSVFHYTHGDMGVIIDANDPDLARQHPGDYIKGIVHTVKRVLDQAGPKSGATVVGIGVDSTGSTPIPVDAKGEALGLQAPFVDNPHAMAWLWKDHTATREAAEITAAAAASHPEYLAKCGGVYSAEWYWAKLLKCARTDPEVFAAAASWVELADWVPAVLTNTTALDKLSRGICAAGHKCFYSEEWGGFPSPEFIASFDDGILNQARASMTQPVINVSQSVGILCRGWAEYLGLPEGIPVAAGAFDCHLGAIGCGIRPGTMVKVIGTSTCDLAVTPLAGGLTDIPGVCGVVPESVLPGHFGIEAGQSAVGDIFNWYVHKLQPGEGLNHAELNVSAATLKPGESGLLALDWMNGNRTVLVDQELTGLILGLTLHSSPGEIFRALIESTAFGARMIRDRMVSCGVKVDEVICCGGISLKSPLLMQIYADVFNCPMKVSASEQTCALGSAMAAAVVGGAQENFDTAVASMTRIRDEVYMPIPENVAVYETLFGIYQQLHDGFGLREGQRNYFELMKDLIQLRKAQRAQA
ncbi:ribulokinase [Kiritimatiellaeota bacterium B1221]|nr:ribulokinase [Kiritimatiellaeota bacterium B1221]